MMAPAIRRSIRSSPRREDGVTILLVAAALVAIMAMAALSIDAVTLYLASANAQQAADAGALAGAKILSLSGMTGDPQNSSGGWAAACQLAQQVATAVANQITVGNSVPATVTVSFPNDLTTNCTGAGTTKFGVNPEVQVQVQSTKLPTFFARIWGRTGSTVSATATAEAFNSSNSAVFSASNNIIPVQPRCVKPWIVPNADPGSPGSHLVDRTSGAITNPGISQLSSGVIGEKFSLFADCGVGTPCVASDVPPVADAPSCVKCKRYNGSQAPSPPNLEYLPGQVLANSTAVPICGDDSTYQQAVAGCDQATVYQCGVNKGNNIDPSNNPGGNSGDTAVGAQCLINQATLGPPPPSVDTLDTTTFPFGIKAGTSNPNSGKSVTGSTSIVSMPIYDSDAALSVKTGNIAPVTIVGFLQVFVNYVDAQGNLNVTVLNVAGCGNGTNPTAGTAISGTSPVPVRLITYP